MRKVIGVVWSLLLVLVLAGHTSAAQGASATADPGNAALAERIADMSRLALAGRQLTPSHFRLAAALLQAANKLDPTNPRYARLWADAMLQVGDADGAMTALKAYVNLVSDDKQALVQLADLHARAYQTVDQRLGYLNDWIDDNRLPQEVRSHLAYMAYSAYVERAQTAQAKTALDKSLKLNPLNLDALQARFAAEMQDGTPYERISTLLAILKSNPAQLTALGDLSHELADLGLATQSLQYYVVAINLLQMQHAAMPPELLRGYAMELAVANSQDVPTARTAAKQITDSLVNNDPSDYQLLCLQLLLERQLDQKDAQAKTAQQAMNVLSNRLQIIRQALGDKTATTRPVTSQDPVQWGSLDENVKRLKALKNTPELDAERLHSAFVDTLAEIAWFEIYFLDKPADAKPLIDALKHTLPEHDALVARLEGWSFLGQGDMASAKVKLSAVAEKEPLAELGLIKMAGIKGQKDGERLLTHHPDGLLAIQILDTLRDNKITLTADPQKATPVLEALQQFPSNWFGILSQPQTFYVIHGEPLKVTHSYAESIYARVSVQNISDYPLTIGADGVIKPEMLFDAQVRGVMQAGLQQQLVGTAVDRLGHELVLQPHQTVTQMCRLDQGPLGQLLSASPAPPLEVTFDVRVNPSSSGVGPSGQMVTFSRSVERSPFALTPASLSELGTRLQQGGPEEKIRDVDLAFSLASIFAQQQQQQNGEEIKRTLMQILDWIKTAARDPSDPVQAWANSVLARFAPPAERTQLASHMINDPYWVARLLGLASMTALPPQDQRSLLHQVLAHETEPVVLQFAKNLNEVFEQSTTQPAATQPATQPTTAPVAQIATTAPTSAPALAADKATVVIPVLPLTTVPSIAPSTAPTTNSTK